jgi:deoxycytidine triphosphate deaminase
MILNDKQLTAWAQSGGVQNFALHTINPASIDLRWSGRFRKAIPTSDRWTDVETTDYLTIAQGELYLLDTIEFVTMPDDCGGMLMLKSSVGRMGLEHLHAGWFDPSFSGTATLEIMATHPCPATITAGQRIVQLVLMRMAEIPAVSYALTGRYNGQNTPQVAR